MDKKKITFVVFCLVVVAQLYVPGKMVFDRENILVTGKPFKFKTAPVDPSDPLRGKYITLNFEETQAKVYDEKNWDYNMTAYVLLSTDSNGYAIIDRATHHEPIAGSNVDYILANTFYYNTNDSTVSIEYPFNRYYMEETKAQAAEDLYRNSIGGSTKVTYALVYVKDGKAVLKDVMINDASIKDLVK